MLENEGSRTKLGYDSCAVRFSYGREQYSYRSPLAKRLEIFKSKLFRLAPEDHLVVFQLPRSS